MLLDISHEDKSAYLDVNPEIFTHYQDVIENQLGSTFILNEERPIDSDMLQTTDVLILLSSLDSEANKRSRTDTEINDIVSFVENGGGLIIFTDEVRRIDMEAFGANDLVRPFGMEFGDDLPGLRNAGAISFVGQFIEGRYEIPYSGARELTGGIPISVKDAEGGHVHGAYVQVEDGGKVVAFGEMMVGLFMGGVESELPDGNTIVWKGADNVQFMKELIDWALSD